MKQLTLRVPDELAADLTRVAAERGQSVNALATNGLRALVDPDAFGNEIERARERLRRAGILATPTRMASRPEAEAVAAARRRAGRGTPLSEIISEERR